MKRNVNVFIGVVLCAVLGGCFWWLASADEGDQWSPNEIYSEVHRTSAGGFSHTHASSVSSNNGGVALTLSSPSATFRRRTSSIYAGAYGGASYAPLASSPMGGASGAGLHLTSSAEIKSFGGGGNGGAAMGGAISNGRSNSGSFSPSLQGGVGVGSLSPIAYSIARRGSMSSGAGDDPVQMMAEQPTMAMTSTAGMANGFYGGYSAMDYSSTATYSSTSDYDQYTGIFGSGRQGVRGRQNLGNVEDTWLNWLALNGSSYGTYDESTQTWYLDANALRSAWEAFCATWNEGMGKKPTWDEWLAWFQGSEGNPYEWADGSKPLYYTYVPVGNILPLLFFALIYVVILFVKRNKIVQL